MVIDKLYSYLALPPYLDDQSSAASDTYPYPDGYNTTPKPGESKGKAVTQLYVELPSNLGLDTPSRQLRQFQKTEELAASQSQTLTLEITRKDP
ncbi:hypothetical protein N7513_007011 [Penicillium frequentans]|nr:hypothetical protein N7513_007011 [Penicillium glabrum]